MSSSKDTFIDSKNVIVPKVLKIIHICWAVYVMPQWINYTLKLKLYHTQNSYKKVETGTRNLTRVQVRLNGYKKDKMVQVIAFWNSVPNLLFIYIN